MSDVRLAHCRSFATELSISPSGYWPPMAITTPGAADEDDERGPLRQPATLVVAV
jgi:hypothetical protein